MNFFRPVQLFVYLLVLVSVSGCSKNITDYYPDQETPGTAIFSNTGNELFSCILNGKPWRTNNRFYTLRGTSYEVYIIKITGTAPTDSVMITWTGYFDTGSYGGNDAIRLVFPVSKNSGLRDLPALQGKRLVIDGSSSYFSASINGLSPAAVKNKGNIYFNSLTLDSSSLNGYRGRMVGLLDADFGSFKISSGRFDHTLNGEMIQ